ncbi:MAG TPA: S41 family peptidase [Mucilaginibacter sp.]|jgi:C-terminal processing protease CtpA/Prc|nr:S41 family peptidase [Mucilaginibacter sp.]
MKRIYVFLIFLLAGSFCKGQDTLKAGFNKRYTVNQLRADFVFFRTILEKAHPSLYRYMPKDSMDRYFDAGMAKIDHPLSELEFWESLQYITAKICSGHTDLNPAKTTYQDYEKAPHCLLPFRVYIHNNRLYVKSYLNYADTSYKIGSEILAVNNESASAILTRERALVTGDGYTNSFKDFKLERYLFNYLYNLLHGDQYQFMVLFRSPEGGVKRALLKAANMKFNGGIVAAKTEKIVPRLSYPADMPATAILNIAHFTYSDYFNFHKRLFRELRHNQIQNLVIDLRGNPGGRGDVCIDMMQYLMKKDFYFTLMEEGSVSQSRFTYLAEQAKKTSIPLDLNVVDHSPYSTHYDFNSPQSLAMNRFKGKVYLLVNRGTFSAASLFTIALKKQMDCVVIGEETGGGVAGCDGGTIVNVKLPNTQFELEMPVMWTYSVDKAPAYSGGLKPDIVFSPTIAEISDMLTRRIDPVMAILKKTIATADTNAKQ